MPTTTEAVHRALSGVVDPCCRERGISVVDMGLVRSVEIDDGQVAVDLLLTSGWCPFQVDLVHTVTEALESLPDVDGASVRITLDEVWTSARMSDRATAALRFLPEPAEVGSPQDYLASHRR